MFVHGTWKMGNGMLLALLACFHVDVLACMQHVGILIANIMKYAGMQAMGL
jgi:hypothetical protein